MLKTYLLFLLFFTYSIGYAQTFDAKEDLSRTTPADSINIFYHTFFKSLKTGYLHRKKVDWKTIEAETYRSIKSHDSLEGALTEITHVFDKIDATHCLVYRKGKRYTATKKVTPKESYSAEWKSKYDSKPTFEVKVLDGKYGYILIPGMVLFDNSAEHIHEITQPLYDQIANVKNNQKIDGWIIDLRFNTGGNSTPMILALYDFLGDQDVWTELDRDQKIIKKHKLMKGNYLYNSKIMASINPSGVLLDQAKVALITGMFTGSSGEVTALSFKGRPNTIFIGENSAGYTTSNISWPLPYETVLALTVGYDGDRHGNYYPYIRPDVVITKLDNFEDLMADANILEGIKFIKGS